MLNIVSIIIGVVALIFALPAFIPLLGWLNWAIIPIAGVGALVGQLSVQRSGRNFCIGVALFCIVRLWLGGGIF